MQRPWDQNNSRFHKSVYEFTGYAGLLQLEIRGSFKTPHMIQLLLIIIYQIYHILVWVYYQSWLISEDQLISDQYF